MGFFDDADVEIAEIPDDPFGFGKDFWPIWVKEVKDPEVTKSGERYGMMVTWAVDHPDFEGTQVADKLGYGNWLQLPVPKPLQDRIPWDPKGSDKKVLFDLKNLFLALGFTVDEMPTVDGPKMVGRRCLAKIGVKQNDQGFWQFNPYAFKPLGDGDGMNEFAGKSGNGKSAKDVIADELDDI